MNEGEKLYQRLSRYIDLPTKDDNKSCSKTGQLLLLRVSIF